MSEGRNIVYVDGQKCIACGECLRACTHGARDYADDTERFFADLGAGKEIPLIVAPAIRCNVPEWARLLGYLQSIGAGGAYDASYGADICTWAYLRHIAGGGAEGLIAHPCPAVVNYIERYVPESLNRLAPVHSPAMCTAIYMNKYKGVLGDYAFLSPCISKRDEFADPCAGGLVGYNVTFRKLMERLQEMGADFRKSDPAGYDSPAHGLGSVFAAPGGLRANVEHHAGGQWIFQVEGQPRAARFLHEYAGERGGAPFLVDILNCAGGCNTGPGACLTESDGYAVGKAMHQVRAETAKPDFSAFDKELDFEDFRRGYTPKKIAPIFVDRHEMELAFASMGKPSHEDRLRDCRACGYHSCQEMAVALAKGINHADNCVDYIRGIAKQAAAGGES